MVLAGFPVVAAFAAGNSLLQALTTDAYRGRVFGTLGAIMGLATLLGLGIGGSAVDAVGVVPVVSAGAAMWIVGGVLALRWLPDRARVDAKAKPNSLAS
jgi:MFS family permease